MANIKLKGFTLIELVVVIVILGILAATALPKLQTIDRDAKVSATQGALATLSSAASISYSTSKNPNTLISIYQNAVFSDPLFSLATATCVTTANSQTVINGSYFVNGLGNASEVLASTVLDNALCSA